MRSHLILLAAVVAVSVASPTSPYYLPYKHAPSYYPIEPLHVLVERPAAVDNRVISAPLIVMPQNMVHVIRNGHINAVFTNKPFVRVQVSRPTPISFSALPAVQVLLREPIIVSDMKSSINVPAGFTVVQDGFRLPLHVESVIAPVPHGFVASPAHPLSLNILYAVPVAPSQLPFPSLPYPIPSLHSGSVSTFRPFLRPGLQSFNPGPSDINITFSRPPVSPVTPVVSSTPFEPVVVSSTPVAPTFVTSTQSRPGPVLIGSTTPSFPVSSTPGKPFVVTTITPPVVSATAPPQGQLSPRPPPAFIPTKPDTGSVEVGTAAPNRPVIHLLEFPQVLQSPSVVFYQPSEGGSELGNREPPIVIPPSGIVQSTAPHLVPSVFINSKESSYLQDLRDQTLRYQLQRP